ncbi:SDR family oxidoreductase [Qipengyuania zhejiangensis]|uniref:SDR family oxidoreductase n=1 Tax=Qipengyuania zhejiangensis TaxID=3077782 RepID=UPI002D77F6BF|nr:SDR family oxidoreductase [Qipengyuania sp. Z2]
MGRFEDRNAIVFGGTSGINLEIATRLAAEGARIFLVSRSQEKVDSAVSRIRSSGYSAAGHAADVRDYEAVDAAVKAAAEEGAIDIVVSGAAGNFLAPAADISSNAFRTVIDIDLVGTFNTARASFAAMRKPGASFIAISAPQAEKPMTSQAHACAAKAGINMLVKCLALEWGEQGIRVNAISPGPIDDTEGMRRLAGSDAAAQAIADALPLKRYGTKQDVADAACFLASQEGAYITGTILNVDGGTSLGTGRLV